MDPGCGPKIVLSQGQKNTAKKLHSKLQKERHIHQGRGGRKQVNKALHTCTSWYAYAAMFGSSIDTLVPRALLRMYRLH